MSLEVIWNGGPLLPPREGQSSLHALVRDEGDTRPPTQRYTRPNPESMLARNRRVRAERAAQMIGRVFGRWTVVTAWPDRQRPDGKWIGMWWCRCACGTERAVRATSLQTGLSLGCGMGCPQRRRTGVTLVLLVLLFASSLSAQTLEEQAAYEARNHTIAITATHHGPDGIWTPGEDRSSTVFLSVDTKTADPEAPPNMGAIQCAQPMYQFSRAWSDVTWTRLSVRVYLLAWREADGNACATDIWLEGMREPFVWTVSPGVACCAADPPMASGTVGTSLPPDPPQPPDPPPLASAPTVDVNPGGAVCPSRVLRVDPPDSTLGWRAQFQTITTDIGPDGRIVATAANLSVIDISPPYVRTVTVPVGTYQIAVRWTKADGTTRDSLWTTWVCR